MGFIDRILEMLGLAKRTEEKILKTTQENTKRKSTTKNNTNSTLLEQKREAHYIDLAEDQYDEDRVLDASFYDDVDYNNDYDEADNLNDLDGYGHENDDDLDYQDMNDNNYSDLSECSSEDGDDELYDSHYNDDFIDEFDDDGENYDGYDDGSHYKHKWDRIKTYRSWGNSFGTDAHNRKSGRDFYDDY